MPIGTGLAIGLGAASIGGSVASSAIGAHAAGKAADAQVAAANHAADLQHQDAQSALQFQQQVYGNSQSELNPYLQAGYGGLANLQSLLGITPQGNAVQAGATPTAAATSAPAPTSPAARSSYPMTGARMGPGYLADLVNSERARSGAINGGKVPISGSGAISGDVISPNGTVAPGAAKGTLSLASLVNPNLGGFGSLMQPYGEKFVAPTGATEQNDPGYQFRLNEGEKALQNSAAAKGTLLNGATAKDINAYGQDYASNEYGNVYNRALGEYQNRYNIFQNDQTNKYNRLANIAGLGQTTASQLNAAGQSAAGNVGNILMSSGQQIGQDYNNAGAARASGYVGGANAWGNAFGSGSNLMNTMLLSKLLGGGGGGGYDPVAGGV